MGWREIQTFYREGNSPNKQKVEDLVARRVLNGLGLIERDLFKVEKELGIKTDFDMPLWPRVKDVLNAVSAGMFSDSDPFRREYTLDCRDTDPKHKPILDHLDEIEAVANTSRRGCIVMCRVDDRREAVAYVADKNEPDVRPPAWLMNPCAVLLADSGTHFVWCRRLETLVADMKAHFKWAVPFSKNG